MDADRPDSALFLQIDPQGEATVWIEFADVVSLTPTIYYRRDRAPADVVPFKFQLPTEFVQRFAVGPRFLPLLRVTYPQGARPHLGRFRPGRPRPSRLDSSTLGDRHAVIGVRWHPAQSAIQLSVRRPLRVAMIARDR
jgi:hypothetical protein